MKKIRTRAWTEWVIVLGVIVFLILIGLNGCREVYAGEPILAGDRVVDLIGREGTVLKAQGCGTDSFAPMDGTGAVLVRWDDEGNVPEWKSTEYVFKRGSHS